MTTVHTDSQTQPNSQLAQAVACEASELDPPTSTLAHTQHTCQDLSFQHRPENQTLLIKACNHEERPTNSLQTGPLPSPQTHTTEQNTELQCCCPCSGEEQRVCDCGLHHGIHAIAAECVNNPCWPAVHLRATQLHVLYVPTHVVQERLLLAAPPRWLATRTTWLCSWPKVVGALHVLSEALLRLLLLRHGVAPALWRPAAVACCCSRETPDHGVQPARCALTSALHHFVAGLTLRLACCCLLGGAKPQRCCVCCWCWAGHPVPLDHVLSCCSWPV